MLELAVASKHLLVGDRVAINGNAVFPWEEGG
jgi:hypothetical protein